MEWLIGKSRGKLSVKAQLPQYLSQILEDEVRLVD